MSKTCKYDLSDKTEEPMYMQNSKLWIRKTSWKLWEKS